jgi:hypothetical protein
MNVISQIPINWLAVVAAAAIQMVLGYFWYSPTLFSKRWIKEQGWSHEDMEKMRAENKGMAQSMIGMFVASLVTMYVLRHAVAYVGAADAASGAWVGFLAWIAFVATVMLNGVFFERKSWTLYWINAGYYLVSLVVAGALLAAWI